MKEKDQFYEDVENVLKRSAWSDSNDYRLINIEDGKNNQAFEVRGEKERFFLKRFYKDAKKSQKRLFAEFSFAQFAWKCGVRNLPQPISYDRKYGIAIYEYIKGRKLKPEEINEEIIEKAIKFFCDINYSGVFDDAQYLPLAAEACFSLKDHISCVDRRVKCLRGLHSVKINTDVGVFLKEELPKLWDRVQSRVKHAIELSGHDLNKRLETKQWCLSPSDFGFHNAFLTEKGEIKFFDFEHAGWDDPAKTICDFFYQEAVPVSMKYYKMFSQAIVSNIPDREFHLQRARLLLPVYKVKWCTIMMNDFLPEGEKRHRFVYGTSREWERKSLQLRKAQSLAASLKEELNI